MVHVQVLADDEPEDKESFLLLLRRLAGERESVDFCGSASRCSTRITIGANDFVVHLRGSVGVLLDDVERTAGKQSVTVEIEDDDDRGVVVAPTLVELRPSETGTYQVGLASQPTGTVTVTLDGPDHEELKTSPVSLTFDGQTWATPQAVSVEATSGFVAPAEDMIAHDVTGADYESPSGSLTIAAGQTRSS